MEVPKQRPEDLEELSTIEGTFQRRFAGIEAVERWDNNEIQVCAL